MKRLILNTIVVMLLFSCSSYALANDIDTENVKEKVKILDKFGEIIAMVFINFNIDELSKYVISKDEIIRINTKSSMSTDRKKSMINIVKKNNIEKMFKTLKGSLEKKGMG